MDNLEDRFKAAFMRACSGEPSAAGESLHDLLHELGVHEPPDPDELIVLLLEGEDMRDSNFAVIRSTDGTTPVDDMPGAEEDSRLPLELRACLDELRVQMGMGECVDNALGDMVIPDLAEEDGYPYAVSAPESAYGLTDLGSYEMDQGQEEPDEPGALYPDVDPYYT